MPKLAKDHIVGSWELHELTLEDKPWRIKSTGLLLYTSQNRVSVAINGSDPEYSWDDNCIFYSGIFEIKEQQIIHHAIASCAKEKIGTRLIRDAVLDGDSLTLTAETPFGFGRTVWRKIC